MLDGITEAISAAYDSRYLAKAINLIAGDQIPNDTYTADIIISLALKIDANAKYVSEFLDSLEKQTGKPDGNQTRALPLYYPRKIS